MKILNLIFSRRTIHLFRSEPVSNQLIDNAVAAAIHAPNHKLTWPWRFFVLGPRARQDLGVIAKSDKYMQCGVIIALAIVRSSDEQTHRENYASMACAVQNMSLYFHSEGVGTKWSTGKVSRAKELYDLLKISPIEFELCGLLWVGYPAQIPDAPKRPELHNFLKYQD